MKAKHSSFMEVGIGSVARVAISRCGSSDSSAQGVAQRVLWQRMGAPGDHWQLDADTDEGDLARSPRRHWVLDRLCAEARYLCWTWTLLEANLGGIPLEANLGGSFSRIQLTLRATYWRHHLAMCHRLWPRSRRSICLAGDWTNRSGDCWLVSSIKEKVCYSSASADNL